MNEHLEEMIFYWGISIAGQGTDSAGELKYLAHCPRSGHHNNGDKRASAVLYSNGWFHCSACGFNENLFLAAGKRIPKSLQKKHSAKPYTYPGKLEIAPENKHNKLLVIPAISSPDEELQGWIGSRGIAPEFLRDFDCLHWAYGGLRISGQSENISNYWYRFAIPIHDDSGRLISYELRKYRETDLNDTKFPKVMYPKGFQRSYFLWNQHQVDITKPVFIAEGILDVQKLYAIGEKNIASTFGSKISDKQLEFIRKIPEVVWVLDNDAAGKQAYLDVCSVNKNTRVVQPPRHDLGECTLDEVRECICKL